MSYQVGGFRDKVVASYRLQGISSDLAPNIRGYGFGFYLSFVI